MFTPVSTRLVALATCILLADILFAQTPAESYTIISYPAMPDSYAMLDKKVDETSGLIYFENVVWTFNDSQGKPQLYGINKPDGKINKTITLMKSTNIDWEDITQDEDYIYIGDFGNNAGNRKDLKIYKIKKDQTDQSNNIELEASIISFEFADQKVFDENHRKHDYDCESIINFDDRLILFSKNWKNGRTRMYSVSKEPGSYKIEKQSSFDVDGLITGADFNKENKKLVMVGYKEGKNFIFIFKDFDGNTLGNNLVYRINLNKLVEAQCEGICFIDNKTVLISTEKTNKFKQQIFSLDLNKILQYAGFEYD
ncbi:MAG: hypothetical protein K9H49_08255 [Bacteroidales bacterium]|nr:hypothetical protein [Bacteroidales bacterium]MCF8404700.1 hypothetical protein [Bacteroidales bacterium]